MCVCSIPTTISQSHRSNFSHTRVQQCDHPALAFRISNFCAKGTRSSSSSTPKSPRATMSASDLAMMPSMLVSALRRTWWAP